jgi:hypothetical protein
MEQQMLHAVQQMADSQNEHLPWARMNAGGEWTQKELALAKSQCCRLCNAHHLDVKVRWKPWA